MKAPLPLWSAFVLLPAVLGAPASAEPAGPPLENGWYVDRGACPFEGCIYREWTVRQDTVLYDAPRGVIPVGTARGGQLVEGLTGIVYTIPIPVDVTHPILVNGPDAFVSETTHVLSRLSVGDRFYLLTYAGEGFNVAWIAGALDSLDIGALRDLGHVPGVDHFRSCTTPSNQCWWQIPEEHLRRQSEWWAEIRLPGGTTGWTNEVEHFGNIDQFGH